MGAAAMSVIRICLTFDVDLVDHVDGSPREAELAEMVPEIARRLAACGAGPATWFVRLDRQIEALHGRPDHAFTRHAGVLADLAAGGHEIGWHPHIYARCGDAWEQCLDEAVIANELRACAPLAHRHGLRAVRMGWGFHTNATMRLLPELGFHIDSSALPRPPYAWETTRKDWTGAPQHPYAPSVADYRRPARPALDLLEIPVTALPVAASYDREPVLRYANPAFRTAALQEPLAAWLAEHDHLVTVTHPYELFPRQGGGHELLSFGLEALDASLDLVRAIAAARGTKVTFGTLSAFAAEWRPIS
jgi:hypothetical protein